jgi:hypothetical protein
MKKLFNLLNQMIITGSLEFKIGLVLCLLLYFAGIILYLYTKHKKVSVVLILFSVYFFFWVMEYEKAGGWEE